MNKLLKIFIAMVLGAAVTACGGSGPEAGTPIFGCVQAAASAASGSTGATCD